MYVFSPEKLAIQRHSKNLTQEKVALALSTSIPRISDWEKGAHVPRFDSVLKLANLYGCSPTDFCYEVI
jgi:transcriptional regulator with XRE-family HTH domain